MNPSADKQGTEFTVEQLAKEVELQSGRNPLADVHLTSQSFVALCKLAASALSSCAARDAVLEEAASACDKFTTGQDDVSVDFAMGIENGARKCANTIRALKGAPVPESETQKEYPVSMTMEKYHECLGYEAECKLRDARSASAAQETLERVGHVLYTCEVRWPGDTVLDYVAALVTEGLARSNQSSARSATETHKEGA